MIPYVESLHVNGRKAVDGEWFDGHSGGDTPGPIPNPAVKPACVPSGTVVREPTGRLARKGLSQSGEFRRQSEASADPR